MFLRVVLLMPRTCLSRRWDSFQSRTHVYLTFHPISTQKQLKDLHGSQINAYKSFARKALSDFAKQVELPNVEPGLDETTYVERICSSLQIPNWKVNPQFVRTIVQKRASAFYQQNVANRYGADADHGADADAGADAEGEHDDNPMDDAEEGSAVGTEDTEDDDDEEIGEGEPTDDKQDAKKIVKNNNRGSKTKQIKRKPNSGKVQRAPTRGRKPSNRGRGRGGGLRGQARQA